MATRFEVRAGTPIYVLLKEVDDAGYVTVNGRHFDLKVDEMMDVTAAMQNGINRMKLVVRNKGGNIAGLPLPGGAWAGRFEVYAAGRIAGAFADNGDDGLGTAEHVVQEIEILANR